MRNQIRKMGIGELETGYRQVRKSEIAHTDMLPTGRFASPAKRAARLPPEPGREKKNAPQGFKLVYFRPVNAPRLRNPFSPWHECR